MSGADRDPRRLGQIVPERADGWVRVAPLPDDGHDLGIAAPVIAGDAPPGADRATKSAGEFGALAELALGRGDLADGSVFVQHAVREHTIKVERLVTGRVEAPESVQLPGFSGKPCIDPAFDGAKVGAD